MHTANFNAFFLCLISSIYSKYRFAFYVFTANAVSFIPVNSATPHRPFGRRMVATPFSSRHRPLPYFFAVWEARLAGPTAIFVISVISTTISKSHLVYLHDYITVSRFTSDAANQSQHAGNCVATPPTNLPPSLPKSPATIRRLSADHKTTSPNSDRDRRRTKHLRPHIRDLFCLRRSAFPRQPIPARH